MVVDMGELWGRNCGRYCSRNSGGYCSRNSGGYCGLWGPIIYVGIVVGIVGKVGIVFGIASPNGVQK